MSEVEDTGGCGGCGGAGCGGDPTKPTEWCNPTTIDCPNEIVPSEPCPEPEKTPVEICTCHTAKACPIHLKLGLTFTQKGCDKHPCIASIPPDLGCAPIKAGVGKWDGGVPAWMNACLTGCDLEVWKAKNPGEAPFLMDNFQSLLDLNTNPEHTTNLHVIGSDYVPRQINAREFFALAVKMYETGMCVSGGVNPNSLGLNYVTAEDGTMMLGIVSNTPSGPVAVGSGMALVPHLADDGSVEGYMLPPAV